MYYIFLRRNGNQLDKFKFVEVRNIENILKNGKILLKNDK